MSDGAKRLENYQPGDDGNLTTGDVHKLIAEVFLAAMRPHYDLLAEEWRIAKADYTRVPFGEDWTPYQVFRAERLNAIERYERERAEETVRRMLAVLAKPYPSTELIARDNSAKSLEENMVPKTLKWIDQHPADTKTSPAKSAARSAPGQDGSPPGRG